MTGLDARPAIQLSFKDQLAQTETFKGPGGTVIKFATAMPELVSNPRPVVVLPAYTKSIRDMMPLTQTVFDLGRPTIGLHFVDQGTRRNGNPYRVDHYPETYDREAADAVALLTELRYGIVDVVAPSHAAVIAPKMAIQTHNADSGPKINNMLLINPGGLILGDTVSALQNRTYEMMVGNGLITQPVADRLLSESVTQEDAVLPYTGELLRGLAFAGHGIAVLVAENDPIFPAEQVKSNLIFPGAADTHDFIGTVPGGHFNFLGQDYTTFAQNALLVLR